MPTQVASPQSEGSEEDDDGGAPLKKKRKKNPSQKVRKRAQRRLSPQVNNCYSVVFLLLRGVIELRKGPGGRPLGLIQFTTEPYVVDFCSCWGIRGHAGSSAEASSSGHWAQFFS